MSEEERARQQAIGEILRWIRLRAEAIRAEQARPEAESTEVDRRGQPTPAGKRGQTGGRDESG